MCASRRCLSRTSLALQSLKLCKPLLSVAVGISGADVKLGGINGAIEILAGLLEEYAHVPTRLCVLELDGLTGRFLCLAKVAADILVESAKVVECGRVGRVE